MDALTLGSRWSASGKFSPLVFAVEAQHVDVVRVLLSAGASIDGADELRTPMMHACRSGNLDLVRVFLDAGVGLISPRAHTDRTAALTPLHAAVENSDVKLLRMLVEAGADINAPAPAADPTLRTVRMLTPLHFAVVRNRHVSVSACIALGADLDAIAGDAGETALHVAARLKRFDIAAELVASGADVYARYVNGRTPERALPHCQWRRRRIEATERAEWRNLFEGSMH